MRSAFCNGLKKQHNRPKKINSGNINLEDENMLENKDKTQVTRIEQVLLFDLFKDVGIKSVSGNLKKIQGAKEIGRRFNILASNSS